MTQHHPTDAGFEEIEHTADWALRVRGRDFNQLLHNAAKGMSSLLVSDLASISPTHREQFNLSAWDAESLLVNWLSELAYRAEAEGLVFAQFHLQEVTPTKLRATAHGGHVSDLKKHIKAVTYHNLEIIDTGTGLEVTIVFDV